MRKVLKKKIAKSVRKDIKDIFEIIKLSRPPKISFIDIVSIVIRVAYRIEIFENARNIEIVHQVAYQKIIRKGNYLELSAEETIIQLLSYIKKTSYLRSSSSKSKGKKKNIEDITLLILLTGI